jgi:ATP phosphoribosyltransferase regulatory subunit HisZ
MTAITLQLSPELEQKLRDSIARRDAQSIKQLLADAFAPTVEALLKQTPTQFTIEDEDELEASIDGLLDEFALSVGAIPTLSDYAVSREGIYEDRA